MRWWWIACLGAFACTAVPPTPPVEQRLPVRVRRLSVREYVRSVKALTGVNVSMHRLMVDSLDTEFDNGPVNVSVQPEQADLFEQLAWEVALTTARDHKDRLEPFLDGFPRLYHEPYFKSYARDDLAELLEDSGFEVERVEPAFFAKVVVARKPD